MNTRSKLSLTTRSRRFTWWLALRRMVSLLFLSFFCSCIDVWGFMSIHRYVCYIDIYIYITEASFSAYVFAIWKAKLRMLAILRQKEAKGRNKKDDQTWWCFVWSKSTFFRQCWAKKCLKGKQKTRPWPSTYKWVCIYNAGELAGCPPFSLQKASWLSTP